MRKERKGIDVFSLSFLDVVSCGFGAIILLLVLSKVSEPLVREKISRDLRGEVQQLEQQLVEIRDNSKSAKRELALSNQQLEELRTELDRRQQEIAATKAQYQEKNLNTAARERIVAQMETALQSLSEEMRRLQAQQLPPPPDSPIGGVPVDSEYIIFVIDTSGSMQRYAWPLVRKKMAETLAIYPRVKGIQVMNDMGDYMFSQYAGRWIPDTPARRRAILKRLASWSPFSNSSPVEGITRAIRRFHTPGRRVSIYVLGDDFSRGSIQAVIDTVDRLNRDGSGGKRLVRIHAIGFPVLLLKGGSEENAARFAALMRRLAWDNNGSFVGLSGLGVRR
jgi:hypothetical protein